MFIVISDDSRCPDGQLESFIGPFSWYEVEKYIEEQRRKAKENGTDQYKFWTVKILNKP